jgi:hypothetical protein
VNGAATWAEQYWHIHDSDCRKTIIYAPTPSRTLRNFDIIVGTVTLPAPETGDSIELLLLYICVGISCHFLKALCGFLLETTLSDSLTLDRGFSQFHLPILYHHLENAGCIVTACVCGGTFLLSDTQINVRQQRYIILLELARIHREEQGVMKSQPIFN